MNNEQKIKLLKQSVSEFISNGGNVENLKTTDEIYKLVKNTTIAINGNRLSLEEKFEIIGFPRQPKRKTYDEHIKSIQEALSEFVAGGGDVNTLCSSDKLYKKVKNSVIFLNGRELTINEKFGIAGFPREDKYNNVKTIISRLNNLENFKDENGFVDTYRKNQAMNAFIDSCSLNFDLPPSLIVTLLANQNLKKYSLRVDRYDYIKTRLAEFVKNNGSLIMVKQKDRRLYDLLCSTAKTYPTKTGRKMTLSELVEELGFGDVENSFIETNRTGYFNEDEFLMKYYPIIKNNGYTISLSDIEPNDYMRLSNYTRRLSISINDFFEKNGVKYVNPKNVVRNAYLTTDEYPYLKEMRNEVNQLLNDYYKDNPINFSDETLFNNRLTACQFVYGKYKKKIENEFSSDKNDGREMSN